VGSDAVIGARQIGWAARRRVMAGFRTAEVPREQLVLWACKLEDAVPADHPVRHVDFLLKTESFHATFGAWEREYVLLEGKPPYHPRDLTGLYLYGMMNRIRSSRQLEAACYNRLDVIWLMSGQHPDHSTISDFVSGHGQRLRSLFKDVLRVAIKAGLVKLEQVAIDGTKIEADAGKGSVHKESTIATQLTGVDEQIQALEAEWQANETREASLFGDQVPWKPSESGSPKQRLAKLEREQKRLREALAAIKRRREETVGGRDPKAIGSVTDPPSRAMQDKEGKTKPNYNAQLAVDTSNGVVTARDVNDQPEDSGLLVPMLSQVQENCGRLPKEASADSQYNIGPDLESLKEMEVTGFLPGNGEPSEAFKPDTPASQALAAAQAGQVLTDAQWEALPKDGKRRIDKLAFRYDAQADVYRCPMGQALWYQRTSKDRKKWGLAFRAQYGSCPACASCPRAKMCCKDPAKGRMINRDQYEERREEMRERMKTEQGRSRYRLRGQTVEPRIGLIKRGLGIRRFMRRGLEAARTEWSVICTVVNVGILLRHWTEVSTVV
jgi:transposase